MIKQIAPSCYNSTNMLVGTDKDNNPHLITYDICLRPTWKAWPLYRGGGFHILHGDSIGAVLSFYSKAGWSFFELSNAAELAKWLVNGGGDETGPTVEDRIHECFSTARGELNNDETNTPG